MPDTPAVQASDWFKLPSDIKEVVPVEAVPVKSIPSKYSTTPPGNAPFLRANREKFLKENNESIGS